MSSGHGNCKVSSAGSSPRKPRDRTLNKNKVKDSSATQLSAALHSAWIQRIIPSHTYRKSPENVKDEEYEGRAAALVHNMELADEDDNEFEVNTSDQRKSWLTARKSMEDNHGNPFFTASDPEVTLTFKAGSSQFNRVEKFSASFDSKVVPVSEDVVVFDQAAAEEIQPLNIPESLGTSAWFTRITKKDAETAAAGVEDRSKTLREERLKTLRCFPPLKSGEQWPGTLKPSNLPPLRIPASKDVRGAELQHLPLLTPVNLIPVEDKEISERNESSMSNTWSLPSNFLEETCRDAKKSLPERHSNSSVKTSSSRSDTESLYAARLDMNVDDEADSASVKKTRQTEALTYCAAAAAAAADNSFSRIVSNCSEKSNHPGQSSHIIPPRSKEQQENDSLDSAAAAASSAKAAARAGQIPRPVQLQVRGSHQWLQRWCTSPGPPRGSTAVIKKLH